MILGSLGGATLAGYGSARWFRGRVPFAATYLCIAMSLALLGHSVLYGHLLGPFHLTPVVLLAGVTIGIAARWCDMRLLRVFSFPPQRAQRALNDAPRFAGTVPSGIAPSSAGQNFRNPWSRIRSALGDAPSSGGGGLASLFAVAVAEEVTYRGLLVFLCLGVSNPLARVGGLLGIVVAFSLSHIRYGWPHVAAKTPLGAFLTAGTVVSRSLGLAVVAHVTFNLLIFRELARRKGAR